MVPWLWAFGVFTVFRLLAYLFFSIVNDMIFAYNIMMCLLWTIFLAISIYGWILIYSLYIELSDLTKLEDLAHLRVSPCHLCLIKHEAVCPKYFIFHMLSHKIDYWTVQFRWACVLGGICELDSTFFFVRWEQCSLWMHRQSPPWRALDRRHPTVRFRLCRWVELWHATFHFVRHRSDNHLYHIIADTPSILLVVT